MQALWVALFLLAAAMAEAQAPVFGSQYSGDVREMMLAALFLICAVFSLDVYASRVHTMVTSQAQDTAVSNFPRHLAWPGQLGYTLVLLSMHHSMMGLLLVACALPSRGQAQVSPTQHTCSTSHHEQIAWPLVVVFDRSVACQGLEPTQYPLRHSTPSPQMSAQSV